LIVVQNGKRNLMKLRGTILISFLLAMLLFTACGQNEATTAGNEPAAVEEATAVAAVVMATETSQPIEETAAPTAEPEEAPATEEPTPAPVLEITSENCLNCHGDKEQLIDTAAPEPEETESSESSGVG
jgi:nitrate reductase cytochrome c-type subunit